MNSSGSKSKRYYVSKNFYRYVRPGDIRIEALAAGESNIYPLAFKNDTAHTNTIVLINDNAESKAVNLTGSSLPSGFSIFTTSATDDCKDYGTVNTSGGFLLPPNSVSTLYKKN
jgi:O-glycosyl hydrolase